MNIDIRQAVRANLRTSNENEIRSTIADAVSITDEKVLPGLGVMFEVYWKSVSDDERTRIANTIANSLN